MPTDADAAIAALPPGDRAGAAQIVDYLTRSGVLVAAGATEASDRPAADSAILMRNHLRLLARSVYDLACDVLGLGPELSEKALAEQTGIGLERRLIAAWHPSKGSATTCCTLRAHRIKEQLSALGVDATTKNLQLHIGCGKGHLSGWINIDVRPRTACPECPLGTAISRPQRESRICLPHARASVFPARRPILPR